MKRPVVHLAAIAVRVALAAAPAFAQTLIKGSQIDRKWQPLNGLGLGIGVTTPRATLDIAGTLSGHKLTLSGLRSCTLKTSATGMTLCGTDDTGTDSADDLSDNTTTDLAEGSRLYFTNERVDGRVDALIVDGSNISTVYDDGAGSLTINATDTNTTYTAGQGLALVSTSFRLGSSLSGSMLRFSTVSGSTVKADTRLTSSGTLAVEGNAYLGGTLTLNGLPTFSLQTVP